MHTSRQEVAGQSACCQVIGTATCKGLPKQSKTPEANQSRNLPELCQASLDPLHSVVTQGRLGRVCAFVVG